MSSSWEGRSRTFRTGDLHVSMVSCYPEGLGMIRMIFLGLLAGSGRKDSSFYVSPWRKTRGQETQEQEEDRVRGSFWGSRLGMSSSMSQECAAPPWKSIIQHTSLTHRVWSAPEGWQCLLLNAEISKLEGRTRTMKNYPDGLLEGFGVCWLRDQ